MHILRQITSPTLPKLARTTPLPRTFSLPSAPPVMINGTKKQNPGAVASSVRRFSIKHLGFARATLSNDASVATICPPTGRTDASVRIGKD